MSLGGLLEFSRETPGASAALLQMGVQGQGHCHISDAFAVISLRKNLF